MDKRILLRDFSNSNASVTAQDCRNDSTITSDYMLVIEDNNTAETYYSYYEDIHDCIYFYEAITSNF